MHRARLKNRYHKFPTEKDKNLYKQHRTFCVSLLKKEKKHYYNNLVLKVFEDNKKNWRVVEPLFSEKAKLKTIITLIENAKMITDKKERAQILNTLYRGCAES